MYDTDVQQWSFWVWWVHAFGAYALVGFIYFWFRLHRLEGAATGGMPAAVARYNGALEGFPNAVYGKMMGKRRMEP